MDYYAKKHDQLAQSQALVFNNGPEHSFFAGYHDVTVDLPSDLLDFKYHDHTFTC